MMVALYKDIIIWCRPQLAETLKGLKFKMAAKMAADLLISLYLNHYITKNFDFDVDYNICGCQRAIHWCKFYFGQLTYLKGLKFNMAAKITTNLQTRLFLNTALLQTKCLVCVEL